MNYQKVKSILRNLCQYHAIPGAEKYLGASEAVATQFRQLGLVATIDPLGNVLAQWGRGTKTILVEAHGDEVGFLISQIKKPGYYKFVTIGSINPAALIDQSIDILASGGEITGKIINEKANSRVTSLADLVIKIDLSKNKQDDIARIKVGDLASFSRQFRILPQGEVASPGLDNKVGVTALIRLAEFLSIRTRLAPKIKIVLAMTVQHEQGNHRGIDVILNQIEPSFALVVDSAYAQPLSRRAPQTSYWSVPVLGRGPAIEMLGQGFCLQRSVFDFLRNTAERSGVYYQLEIPDNTTGGTNISGVYNRYRGIPTGVINVPVRFQHTAAGRAHLSDIENGACLLQEVIVAVPKFIRNVWKPIP